MTSSPNKTTGRIRSQFSAYWMLALLIERLNIMELVGTRKIHVEARLVSRLFAINSEVMTVCFLLFRHELRV